MMVATPSFFAGRWRMARIVENASDGAISRFRGEAEFSPTECRNDVQDKFQDGVGLVCRERGVMWLQGTAYRAGRSALWWFPGGDRIEVQHEDGRPFHDFLTHDPSAVHHCGADRYCVRYDFGENFEATRSEKKREVDHWTSVWEVKGPRKAYRMVTRYRRIGARLAFSQPEEHAFSVCVGRTTH